MSTRLRGGCHCGALAIEVELTQPPSAYAPRACDCSFCRKHGAAWFSDARGRVTLTLRDADAMLHYRQGSEQAHFIACAHCAVLVMVTCEADGRRHAAVNTRAIDAAPFADEQPASPQQLSPQDKLHRWQQLWFADVRIESA